MSDDAMDKVDLLKKRAVEFEAAFRRYANIDQDAEIFLRNIDSLFEEIEQNFLIPPVNFEFSYYYFGTDGPLYKYPDLRSAAANFVAALEDWSSQPWFKSISE